MWDFPCRLGGGICGFVGDGARDEANEEATIAFASELAVSCGTTEVDDSVGNDTRRAERYLGPSKLRLDLL